LGIWRVWYLWFFYLLLRNWLLSQEKCAIRWRKDDIIHVKTHSRWCWKTGKLIIVAWVKLTIFVWSPTVKLIFLRGETKDSVSSDTDFTHQRNFLYFLKLLSEGCTSHVDSQLIIKVLPKSVNLTLLGEKSTKLITKFTVNKRCLLLHKVFVYPFGYINVMFTELSPDKEFIILGYGNWAWQSRCNSINLLLDLNLLKSAFFKLVFMVTERFKSLISCTKDVSLVGKGDCEKCSTTDLNDEFVFNENVFLFVWLILHLDL
jgi:hypothetical protein